MSKPAACAGRSGGAAKCRSNARHYAGWLDSATPAGGWLHMGRSTLETRCGRGDSATVRIVGKVLFSLSFDCTTRPMTEPYATRSDWSPGTTRRQRACAAEWKLIAATHNILKLWRLAPA